MHSIEFSSESLRNIDNVKNYISKDNIIIADKVIDSILKTINYLTTFPKL
jgi:hypothetical protein